MSTEESAVILHDNNGVASPKAISADSTSQSNVSEGSSISDGAPATEESTLPSAPAVEASLVNSGPPHPDSQTRPDGTPVPISSAESVSTCTERMADKLFAKHVTPDSNNSQKTSTTDGQSAIEQPFSLLPSSESDAVDEETSAASSVSYAHESCEESSSPSREPTRPFGTAKKSVKRTIPTVIAGSRPRCSLPSRPHPVDHVSLCKECAVPNCSNTDDSGKRFYRSPVDLQDRVAWLQAMGVRSLKAIRFFVCEDHFPRGGQTMAYVNGKYQSRDGLLSSIIPSLNMPSHTMENNQSSTLQHQPKSVSSQNAPRQKVIKKISARKSDGIRRSQSSSVLQKPPTTDAVKNKNAGSPPTSSSPTTNSSASTNFSSSTSLSSSTYSPSTNSSPSTNMSHSTSTNASQKQQLNQTKDVLALLNGNIAKLIAYVQPSIRTVGVSAVGESTDLKSVASNPPKSQASDIPQAPKKTELALAPDEPTITSVERLAKESPALLKDSAATGKITGEVNSCATSKTVHSSGRIESPEISKTPAESQTSIARASTDSKSKNPVSGEKSAEVRRNNAVDQLLDNWKSSISSDVSPEPKSKYNTRRSKGSRDPGSKSGRFNFRFPRNEYVSDISSDESEEKLSGWEESSSSWASEDDSFGYNRRKRTKRLGDQQKANDGSKRPKADNDSSSQSAKSDTNYGVKTYARVDAKAIVEGEVKNDTKNDKADCDLEVSMDETVSTVRVGDREFSYKKVHCPDEKSKLTYAERYFVVSESTDVPDWKKTPPPMPPSLDSLMKGMHSFFDDFISKMEDMHLAFKQQFSGKKDVITLANDWFLMLIDRLNMFPSVIVSELTRIVETSRQFFSNEAQKVITENKKTRWCAGCWEPAKFHCCFYAAYCSSRCQTKDWKKHKPSCTQKQCSLTDPNLKMNILLTEKLRNINNGVITISDLERFLDAEKAAKSSAVKHVEQQFRPLLPKIVSKSPSSNIKTYLPVSRPTMAIANTNVINRYVAKTVVPKSTFTTKSPAPLKSPVTIKSPATVSPPATLTPPDSANDDDLTSPNYEAESLDGICVVEPDPLDGSQSESTSDDDDHCKAVVPGKKRKKSANTSLSVKFAKELSTTRTETDYNSDDSSGSLTFTPHFLEGFGLTPSQDSSSRTSNLSGSSAQSPATAKSPSTAPALSNQKVRQFLNGIGGIKTGGPGSAKPLLVKMITLASGETQLVQMNESEVAANPKLLTMAAGWIPPATPVSQSIKSSGSVVISSPSKTDTTMSRTLDNMTTVTTSVVKPNAGTKPPVRGRLKPAAKRSSPHLNKTPSPVPMPNLTPIVKKESPTVRIIDDPTLERILNSDNLLMNAFETSFYKNTRIRD